MFLVGACFQIEDSSGPGPADNGTANTKNHFVLHLCAPDSSAGAVLYRELYLLCISIKKSSG